jgi:hypothetical protein
MIIISTLWIHLFYSSLLGAVLFFFKSSHCPRTAPTFAFHEPVISLCPPSQLIIDQFTRDALIVLAGSKEKGRDFVYFTEVKRIPSTDLATIERLWNKFSGGKFGFSVQKVGLKRIHSVTTLLVRILF